MEVNEGSYLFKHCSEARFVTHTQTTVDHYIAISERLSELGYEHY